MNGARREIWTNRLSVRTFKHRLRYEDRDKVLKATIQIRDFPFPLVLKTADCWNVLHPWYLMFTNWMDQESYLTSHQLFSDIAGHDFLNWAIFPAMIWIRKKAAPLDPEHWLVTTIMTLKTYTPNQPDKCPSRIPSSIIQGKKSWSPYPPSLHGFIQEKSRARGQEIPRPIISFIRPRVFGDRAEINKGWKDK